MSNTDWERAAEKYCELMKWDPTKIVSYDDGTLRYCTTTQLNFVKDWLKKKYEEEQAYQVAIKSATKEPPEPKEYPPSERGYL